MKFKVLFSLCILLIVSACGATKTYPKQAKRVPFENRSGQPVQGQQAQPEQSGEYYDYDNYAVGDKKIAILLPLSGQAQRVGQTLLDATQMALFEENEDDISVTPYDTRGTAEGATEAIYQAIENGASIVIGPLFSSATKAVAPIARGNNISVFSFSNNQSVAGNGVYIMGLIPQQQIKRLVDYSTARGKKNFSALIPNDLFGNEVQDALKKYAPSYGGNIKQVVRYSSQTPQFDITAKQFDEELQEDERVMLTRERDVLIMPEGGERLERMLIALQQYNINSQSVQLVGTFLWDNDESLGIPELDNAWYTAVPYYGVKRFMDKFKDSFGYEPEHIATIAYDALKLAIELADYGFNPQKITDPRGFDGVNGAYRFRADGINERQYDIMEVSNGSIYVLDSKRGF